MSYLTRSSSDESSTSTSKDEMKDKMNCTEVVTKITDVQYEDKRRSRLMWLFTFNAFAVTVGHVILTVYTHGVIRTIERRFSLSSSKTGLITSCKDIVHICLVIFVGYFGQKYNKPRMLCVTIMFSAIAGLMMASPHVLFSDYDDSFGQRKQFDSSSNENISLNSLNQPTDLKPEDFTILPNNVYKTPFPREKKTSPEPTKDKNKKDVQFCSNTVNSTFGVDSEIENCEKSDQRQDHPAFYIFVAAQLICGIGSSGTFTITLAYLDENSPKHKTSIYLGVFMSMFALAPISAYMLATFCLKFPENILSGASVDPSDPSFIGCWWLGYLITAIYIVVFAIPLWWYPKQISSKNYNGASDVEKVTLINDLKKESFLKQLKEIPKAFVSLMSNKLVIFNICQIVCGAFTFTSIFSNLVRYIEIHFNRTAAEGSLIAGVIITITAGIGHVTGGALVSKFKLRTIGGIRIVLFASFVYAAGSMILMNLACPQVEMDMNFDPNLELNTVINDCNKACDCTTNRVDYRPICASNNVSYFSPCLAGCSESVNDTFSNCTCLMKPLLNNATFSFEYTVGAARKGYCITPCNLLIPFAVTLFVMSFGIAIARVPATMISLRIVKDEERSFALGLNSFAMNLFGFVPSPLIMGNLIDRTCILWQVTCRVVGACLMFDVARFRYSIFGVGFVTEVINFSFNFIIFIFLRKMALGLSPLARQQIENCSSEVKVADGNNKSIEDGLKSALEKNDFKTNDACRST